MGSLFWVDQVEETLPLIWGSVLLRLPQSNPHSLLLCCPLYFNQVIAITHSLPETFVQSPN